MVIESLELKDFRNYEYLKMDFSPSTNILFGKNGQGKTNILESIYLSATTRSHRGSKDREMIRFTCDEAHVLSHVKKNLSSVKLDIHLRNKASKGVAINHVPVRRASDLFGVFSCIVFSPEDLSIVKSGPKERRRFIDRELSQIDKVYLSDLSNYNKALNHRNRLLKEIYFDPSLRDTLDVWDEQLVTYGSRVIDSREKFILELNKLVESIYFHISGGRENVKIYYNKNTEIGSFKDSLSSLKERDFSLRTTHVGPHRDDISFMSGNMNMRKYGSQGQQRTCAVVLKLAQIELVKKKLNEKPVLLLDDVLSELDRDRQNFLMDYIKDVQTIITTTGIDDFVKDRLKIDNIYEIKEGKIV